MIRHIAARELRAYFLSPLAWTVLAVIQFVVALLFLRQLEAYLEIQPQLAATPGAPGVTEVVIAPVFGTVAVLLMLVVPLLTMRLVAEERRAGTLPLLLSAPLSMTDIILGKYLGLMGLLGALLLLLGAMPLSLALVGGLDWGLFTAVFLGLALMLAAFGAAGLWTSTLTANPVVAAVAGFGLLILLWIIGLLGSGGQGEPGLLARLSVQGHLQALLSGRFDTADVAYFVLFAVTFLVLGIQRLDAERRGG